MEDNTEIYLPIEAEGHVVVSHACVIIDGNYIEVPFTQTDDGVILHLDLVEVQGHG